MTVSAARKRELKHRRSMERERTAGYFNRFDYDHCAELAQTCAVKAVQTAFGHLSDVQIVSPPRAYKDAQFARQIVIRMLVVDFGIMQRQISRMQARQRTSIHFAVQAVDKRMECDVFCAAYERMARAAIADYQAYMERAA